MNGDALYSLGQFVLALAVAILVLYGIESYANHKTRKK